MILEHPSAGILWSGEHALMRGQWEDGVSLLLQQHGFTRVNSPFLYTKDLHTTFQDFVGSLDRWPFVIMRPKREDFTDELAFLEDVDKYKDCQKYVYLGHKGLCHIVMMQTLVADNNVLPLKFYEFSEVYDLVGDKVRNSAGLYLSVACKPEDVNEHAASIYAIMSQTGATGLMNLDKQGIKPGTAPAGELQYRASNGKKEDGGLVIARARYTPCTREKQ